MFNPVQLERGGQLDQQSEPEVNISQDQQQQTLLNWHTMQATS